ncbi:MAG: DUF3794 domain-containing protein [Acutalibacteraceae bacterium]
MYSSGMGETLPEHMEYTIPYSQMIDCAGVTEQCMCDVRVEAMGADVQIKTDSAEKICCLKQRYGQWLM